MTKYLSENEDVLETFWNFYLNPDKIDIKHVLAEMQSFYKWLSERIHNVHAIGDYRMG